MKDEAFNALNFKATIIPEQCEWPEPKYSHWAGDSRRCR